MNESDALKKLCPLRREKCIGSECMLWRSTGEDVKYTGNDIMVRDPGGGGHIEKETFKVPKGECGLSVPPKLPDSPK